MPFSAKQVERAKRAVCKVMCVGRDVNWTQPYIEEEENVFGGTAFFVDAPTEFHWAGCGPSHAHFHAHKDTRYALTNFHVVETLIDGKCLLRYPDRGASALTATVVYICPALDVAILSIDPHGDHPMWFDGGDVRDFIANIPNLKLATSVAIKGNSQPVMAIGFPNLSQDYQLCKGCVSGREMGMIQLSISFNGGNSGGPLLLDGKVIGICTATVSDSEALGLAGPIYQIVRFFRHYADYNTTAAPLLLTPSWGIDTIPTTRDYLECNGIDAAVQGCRLSKILAVGAVGRASLRERDILMGITTTDEKGRVKRYNIDNHGTVKVDWTDRRVPIDNQEFILSLDPHSTTFDVFQWHGKKMKRGVPIIPSAIDFQVRTRYYPWETPEFALLGGVVFMDLCMQHLEPAEEEEEEAVCPPSRAIPLAHFLKDTLHMETAVVVTYVPPQSHVAAQRRLNLFDRIVKANGKRVKDVAHLETVIGTAVEAYNDRDGDETDQRAKFVILETGDGDKIELSLERLRVREEQDAVRPYYPSEKCQLFQGMVCGAKRKKRRRTVV